MKYQAILFDIDGTLVDSFPPYAKIMKTVLSKYNRVASTNDLKQTFSMSLGDAFNFLKIPRGIQTDFERDYMIQKMNFHEAPALFPGIATTFKRLSQTTLPATAIVTSGGNEEVQALKKHYPFIRSIWTAVTADTFPYHKPAPEPLLTAVDRMGISVDQALYIGDALVDMKAAQNAKMDFGIAGWGADPKVHFTDYTYRFERPQDILKLL